jgi:hypothetical protein
MKHLKKKKKVASLKSKTYKKAFLIIIANYEYY